MAAGSDLLDEVFFNTEVDEKVVSDLVGSLESELTGSGHGNTDIRGQAVGNHIASPGVGGNASVQESKLGLAQDLAKAGAGVQGGVINNTRSQGSDMDATTGITSSAGSEASVGLSQGKTVAVSAMVTAVPNHGAGNGKIGTSAVQTLNGSNVVMNSHNSGSAAVFPGTPVSSATTCSSSSTAPAVTVVNNGPGSVVKGNVNAVLPSASSTVIQTSFVNAQNVVTSTVISSQATSLGSGPTVTLVRPPMHTTGPGTTQNGSTNSTVLTSAVSVASLPAPVGSGISLQAPLLNSSPSPVSAGAQVIKSESPKTIIQTTAQAVAPGVVANAGNLTLGQPMQNALQPGPPPQPSSAAAIGKSPVLQNVARTSTPGAVVPGPVGIRTIAPQVLAPRLPHAPQNQPNIQNIQLPPGMVLVRSDSGQLLMIHQQTLAQMQAQSQSQSAMAPRPSTPTSTPPVQITSVQAPGTPIIARQVTPTTIIKQASPAQTTVQATTTLQRPPVLQNPIVLGGTATATSIGAPSSVQPGASQRTVTGATGTPATTATETLENVKKCKNFLSTLIKLASSGKQSSETAANVKELVQNLLEGKIEAEDFTSRLYRELNSSPQPYLVPFLKRSLPALRQLTPDSTAFIQQSQLQQPSTQATTTLTAVVLGSTVQRTAGKTTATVTSTLHQPVISLAQPSHTKPGQPAPLILQSQQQGTMVRPQVTLTQTPMVTLRPPHSRIMLSPQPVQVKQLQTVPMVKQTVLPGTKVSPACPALTSAAQKNKMKDAGGGSFRDDDDINDVASMAGVNLSEESARILATNSELVGTLTRSCKDEAFLFTSSLHRRILDIGKKYGITELGPEVVNFVSHATQQRLQNVIEKVSEIAQQRNMSFKEDDRYEQVNDVRSQLKFFEQLDQIEKQRKEEQEREILMKAAKSRSRQEDPEQLRLKQKAKEMQQQELAQMRQRDANLTALAAIGPRKKRKLDSPGSGAGAEGSGSHASLPGSSSAGASRQFTRQRITRVNLRDLLFCLENERETSHSHLLYRAFLK
uniref:TATA-box binding protein associated factor 4 n=1 Tax=Lepisosteus oculatus TaxID=7918 RepID=W5M7Z7_LEPOC|nr:PREDICTED: transcription initiation factor TFIID subunit 4 [Lepisosteus oculatus]